MAAVGANQLRHGWQREVCAIIRQEARAGYVRERGEAPAGGIERKLRLSQRGELCVWDLPRAFNCEVDIIERGDIGHQNRAAIQHRQGGQPWTAVSEAAEKSA